MTDYKRGAFKGEKSIQYLKSEMTALLTNYAPQTMYGDDMTDFNHSLRTIREDFEKFDGFHFKEFWESAIKKQYNNDPSYLEPTVFLDEE